MGFPAPAKDEFGFTSEGLLAVQVMFLHLPLRHDIIHIGAYMPRSILYLQCMRCYRHFCTKTPVFGCFRVTS